MLAVHPNGSSKLQASSSDSNFMTLAHTVNDAITAILGALLPTLQVKFDAGASSSIPHSTWPRSASSDEGARRHALVACRGLLRESCGKVDTPVRRIPADASGWVNERWTWPQT